MQEMTFSCVRYSKQSLLHTEWLKLDHEQNRALPFVMNEMSSGHEKSKISAD